MRVAMTKFSTVLNPIENQKTCIKLIKAAAKENADLIVLPQYANTYFYNTARWSQFITPHTYHDHNHAWQDAVRLNGSFLKNIALLAKQYQSYIVINVTLRQDSQRKHNNASLKSNISVASCLYSPHGQLVNLYHKTSLSESERVFFTALAPEDSNNNSLPDTSIGLLMGDDTLSHRSVSKLANGERQLICNSVDIGSKEQAYFHDLTYANDNNVFIVTSNKYGLSPELDNPSQIISTKGTVLASLQSEGVMCVDLALESAGLSKKIRPDDSKLKTSKQSIITNQVDPIAQKSLKPAKTINAAIFATYKAYEEAIADVCHYIENNVSDIIQLPELFFLPELTNHYIEKHMPEIERLSEQCINKIALALNPMQYVCTSLVVSGSHQAVLIGQQGIVARQQQLHYCNRHKWSELSNALNIHQLRLEQGYIHFAMLTSDDVTMNHTVHQVSQGGGELLLVPFDIQEMSEVNCTLISRAIEHNICIVAASREKSFKAFNIKSQNENSSTSKSKKSPERLTKSTGLIISLPRQSEHLPNWRAKNFKGFINEVIIKRQFGKITKAVIHPRSSNSD